MHEWRELYIEPTSHCNLSCVMCARRSWTKESAGHMDLALFDKTMDEIPPSVRRIFFGGVGEPLHHPAVIYMLRRAKETGRTVEMITNGTLLSPQMSREIVEAKLDMLWISLDGTEEKSYEDIRQGASFKTLMDNIQTFNKRRFHPYGYAPRFDRISVKLGISFVLMKHNLEQFKLLFQKAQALGIAQIKATHLIPYDESQIANICYEQILPGGAYDEPSLSSVRVDIPFLDLRHIREHDILSLVENPVTAFSIMGTPLYIKENDCRFVRDGIAFLRWDGELSPCMALLHEHTLYQQGAKRNIRPCSFGSAKKQPVIDTWESDAYRAFRTRMLSGAFSHCTRCQPCEDFESNLEDCSGNPFPACGACLWAQGLIQCP